MEAITGQINVPKSYECVLCKKIRSEREFGVKARHGKDPLVCFSCKYIERKIPNVTSKIAIKHKCPSCKLVYPGTADGMGRDKPYWKYCGGCNNRIYKGGGDEL